MQEKSDATRKGYRDELMRAAARDDAASVRRKVDIYHEYYRIHGKAKEAYLRERSDDLDVFQVARDDPDRGLALVALAASMYDEPDFLFLIAAGPLEDVLREPSDEIIDRIVAEARKSARFRWMLTGVFLHAIATDARPRIVEVVGAMRKDDSMPPRPV